jgi:hypothetical protein
MTAVERDDNGAIVHGHYWPEFAQALVPQPLDMAAAQDLRSRCQPAGMTLSRSAQTVSAHAARPGKFGGDIPSFLTHNGGHRSSFPRPLAGPVWTSDVSATFEAAKQEVPDGARQAPLPVSVVWS